MSVQTSIPEAPEELLSLNRLSRKLDLPYNTALRLVNGGKLKPDFISDSSYLFRPSRLPELEAGIRGPPAGLKQRPTPLYR